MKLKDICSLQVNKKGLVCYPNAKLNFDVCNACYLNV